MPLELYKRRHSSQCLAEIESRVASGALQPSPDLEHYRSCRCAWWVRGTTDDGRLVPRHSLKAYTWEAASAALKKLNQPDAPTGSPKLLEAAREVWLAELETDRLAPATIEAYDLAARTLIDFMAARRLRFVQDVTSELLTLMRSKWTVASNTHNTYRTQISTFLTFCRRMKWLTSNPMQDTRGVTKRRVLTEADLALGREDEDDQPNATLPLDEEGDANYQKICQSIVPFLRNQVSRPGNEMLKRNRRNIFLRHPENSLPLCHLMYETGLRISDATFFNPDKLVIDGDGATYTTNQIKTRRPVTVFLDPWLVEEIRSLPKVFRSYPFYDGSKNWQTFINNNFRRVLRQLGQVIGIEGSLRPHRFRDSFAVNRLNEGMTMDELRLLLGHANVSMTERYYAPFVRSRAASLRARYHATKHAKVVPITRAG